MLLVSSKDDESWLSKVCEAVRYEGCAVVTDMLEVDLIERTRAAMYRVQRRIRDDVGQERLTRAAEIGVLRLMARYDPFFLELLGIPEMLAVVERVLSETAILHLQNGFILPPQNASAERTFQQIFHRDFPRYLDGYVASVNVMLAIDPFSAENGGTQVVPGTQQRAQRPEDVYLQAVARPVVCPAGSMIVFDSTLWHAAGLNRSSHDRVAINHQFTRSFIKQQIDYVRALGDEMVLAQPPRVQQLLGWYTRVVTSLEEYYRPADERLYRAGQG
ncbi:MAG: phytanoyl-CoA dioxygenase family protein [Solirubrobacteraceae bacterium]|jgi:ectoine hydroxylase-related dioxygenase (phytanoyl-CoA dioxygenase family)